MNKKIKIAIISHAQVIPVFQNRWKKLAKDPNFEVHILLPRYWIQNWFGEKVIYKPEEIHEGDFHLHPMPTTSNKNWGKYLFVSLDAKFRKIKPDLIYIIHEETIWIHHQIYLYRKFFAPKAKIIFFTMRAKEMKLKKRPHKRWMWNNIKKNTEAVLAHYPGCLKSLRKMGYNKPIYLQTQVGVDENLFKPDEELRNAYRKKIGFQSKFVIGYTGRLVEDKGVDDIINSLPIEGVDWALLLVGNGPMKEKINKKATEEGWNDRIYITGFVQQEEVPKYMNAMDTFLIASKTKSYWIDTFPLVTVQAQACGVPVIASDSGAIPWQLGNSALLFHEEDKNELKQNIIHYAKNLSIRKRYADIGKKRTSELFCHKGMNENLKQIIEQIVTKNIMYHKNNEEYKQWKAY